MSDQKWLDNLRRDIYPWATDDQWYCLLTLFDLVGGEHHLTGKPKPFGRGVSCNDLDGWSSFDFSRLTRAVVLAHDRCIRIEIQAACTGRLRIVLHRRHTRTGEVQYRHPTMEMAIEDVRRAFQQPGGVA